MYQVGKRPKLFPPSYKKILDDIMIILLICQGHGKINDFAKQIEDDYGKQTDAHIYVCRNLEMKHHFGIHYDYSHNLIVQCEGVTNFKSGMKLRMYLGLGCSE